MKFYLDCEFNGFGGELISMALVSSDRKEYFYEVIPYDGFVIDPWVQEHVIPALYRKPTGSFAEFKHKLGVFIRKHAVDNQITIIADWPEDIKYFCDALIIGPGRSIITPNITFELDRTGLVDTSEYSALPHNALEDARALALFANPGSVAPDPLS